MNVLKCLFFPVCYQQKVSRTVWLQRGDLVNEIARHTHSSGYFLLLLVMEESVLGCFVLFFDTLSPVFIVKGESCTMYGIIAVFIMNVKLAYLFSNKLNFEFKIDSLKRLQNHLLPVFSLS